MSMVTIVLWLLAVLFIVVGYVGIVAPALPGPAFVYLGIVLVAWAHDFERIGLVPLVVFGLVTGLILGVDFVSSAVGAKKMGGTKWGALGAVAGLICGMFFPPLGIVLGPLLGAIGAEFLAGQDARRATHAGIGAFLGFLAGTVVKYVACTMILIAAAVAHFW
jgi:uncharacterized protein YqgC (DUF456 family)